MIFIVVLLIGIISVGLSLWSLRSVLKMHEVESAKDTLSKSKILFQRDEKTHLEETGETKIF